VAENPDSIWTKNNVHEDSIVMTDNTKEAARKVSDTD
jgi:hypothetical protein